MNKDRDEARLFDVRNIERNVERGVISRKDVDKFLKALPDVAEKAQTFSKALERELARPAPLRDRDDRFRSPVVARPLVAATAGGDADPADELEDEDDEDEDDEDGDEDGDEEGDEEGEDGDEDGDGDGDKADAEPAEAGAEDAEKLPESGDGSDQKP